MFISISTLSATVHIVESGILNIDASEFAVLVISLHFFTFSPLNGASYTFLGTVERIAV